MTEDLPFPFSADLKTELKDFDDQIAGLEKRMKFYISHIYRATHEESVRPEIIANMKEGECIVILDWKMKFLAAKQREAMQEFFGKAGITWEKR